MKPNKSGVGMCLKTSHFLSFEGIVAAALVLVFAFAGPAATAEEAPPAEEAPASSIAERVTPGMRAISLSVEPVWAELLVPGDRVDVVVNLAITGYRGEWLQEEYDLEEIIKASGMRDIQKILDTSEPMSIYLFQDKKIISISEKNIWLECAIDESNVLSFTQFSAGDNEARKNSIEIIPRNPESNSIVERVQFVRTESFIDLSILETAYDKIQKRERTSSTINMQNIFSNRITDENRAILLPLGTFDPSLFQEGSEIDIFFNLYVFAPIENTTYCFSPAPKKLFLDIVEEPMGVNLFQRMRVLKTITHGEKNYIAIECLPEEAALLAFVKYSAATFGDNRAAFDFSLRHPDDDSMREKVSVTRYESLIDLANLEALFQRSVSETIGLRKAEEERREAPSGE